MERVNVESSQIKSVGYDPETQQMDIEFKGGSVYRYDKVEPEIFDCLMIADSIGRYFGQVIKPFPEIYPFTRIRDTDLQEAAKEAQGA